MMNAMLRLRFLLPPIVAAVMFGALASATHAQEIVASGGGTLRQAYEFDFDRAREQQDGADVWFIATDSQHMFLVPRSGATMSLQVSRPMSRATCAASILSASPIPLTPSTVEGFICVRTDIHAIGYFKVNGVAGNATALTLSLSYWLWSAPLRDPDLRPLN
jgi:hypothetical protein